MRKVAHGNSARAVVVGISVRAVVFLQLAHARFFRVPFELHSLFHEFHGVFQEILSPEIAAMLLKSLCCFDIWIELCKTSRVYCETLWVKKVVCSDPEQGDSP